MVAIAAAEQGRRATAGLQEVVSGRAAFEQILTTAKGAAEYGIAAGAAKDGRRAASHEEEFAGIAVTHVVGTDRVDRFAAAAGQNRIRIQWFVLDEIAAAAKLQDAMAGAGTDRIIAAAECTDRIVAVAQRDQPVAAIGRRDGNHVLAATADDTARTSRREELQVAAAHQHRLVGVAVAENLCGFGCIDNKVVALWQ